MDNYKPIAINGLSLISSQSTENKEGASKKLWQKWQTCHTPCHVDRTEAIA
jgi:hypothetical protein